MNPRDMLAALRDAILIKIGHESNTPHPLADRLAGMPLAQIAEIAGELTVMETNRRPASDRAIMGMGLSRSDFGMAIGDAFKELANYRYDAFSEHRKLCAEMPVSNFNDIHFPEVQADLALKEINELANYEAGSMVGEDGMVVKSLRTFGRIISVGRHVVVNDDLRLLNEIFASLGSSAARLENKMTFEALEANPNLQDGEPVFSTDRGNDLTSAELSDFAIGLAMEALRNQPLRRAEPSNNKPRFLIVSPDAELYAIKLVKDSLPNVEVVASPHVKAKRWYLMADPDVAPVIHRLTLKGASNSILVEPAKRTVHFDGIRLKARADLGVVVTGRVGIVRGGDPA